MHLDAQIPSFEDLNCNEMDKIKAQRILQLQIDFEQAKIDRLILKQKDDFRNEKNLFLADQEKGPHWQSLQDLYSERKSEIQGDYRNDIENMTRHYAMRISALSEYIQTIIEDCRGTEKDKDTWLGDWVVRGSSPDCELDMKAWFRVSKQKNGYTFKWLYRDSNYKLISISGNTIVIEELGWPYQKASIQKNGNIGTYKFVQELEGSCRQGSYVLIRSISA